MAVKTVEMFIYVLIPALGFTIVGWTISSVGGCMLTNVLVFFYRTGRICYELLLFVYVLYVYYVV